MVMIISVRRMQFPSFLVLSMTPYCSCHLLLPFAPLVDGKEGAFDEHDDKDDNKCDDSNHKS